MDANTNPAQANPTLAPLTLDELHLLHTKLSNAHVAVHYRLIDRETGRCLVPVFSDEWNILEAHAHDMHELASEVYAEITRRVMADA